MPRRIIITDNEADFGPAPQPQAPRQPTFEEVARRDPRHFAVGATNKDTSLLSGPLLPALGGLAAMPFTGGMSAPAAIGFAGLMGGGGEAARQIAARAMGGRAPETSGEAAREIGLTGGLNALAEGVGPAWRGTKWMGGKALESSSEVFAKVPPEAWTSLRKFPEKVAGYARQGMTEIAETGKPIAKAMQTAIDYGTRAQERVRGLAQGAGKRFGQMMEYLKRDESGARFPVAGRVYDRMEPYIEAQTSFRSPTLAKELQPDAATFGHFYDRIKNTLQEGMAPGEAADLLQQMTAVQAKNKGAPISAHLEELKTALLDALPGEYGVSHEFATPRGWNIRETRGEYRTAKELQREMATIPRSETPVTAIQRALNRGGKTGRAIRKLMKRSPEFAEDVQEMVMAAHGAQFAPRFKTPPATGLTGAAGILATKMMSSPLAAGEAVLAGLGMSPRAAMTTRLAAGKMAAKAEGVARKARPGIPALIAAIMDKYRTPEPEQ